MILVVLVICCLVPAAIGQGYVNDYDQGFVFQCPAGQSFSVIRSRHHNYYEDRQYGFSCKNTPGLGSCTWSGYINDFDESLLYQCPGNGVISGMTSYHSNRAEDRRFQFYCCDSVRTLSQCTFSGYVNEFDGYFRYQVLANRVLKGVSSYHHNYYEDRRFSFEICLIN